MKRIAIVVGHGPTIDRGAVNRDGTTELDWNNDLAYQIHAALAGRMPATIIRRSIERHPPYASVNALDAVVAVELHLNASDGTASGTEMIYYPGSEKGAQLAKLFQTAAVGVLGLPNRGIKTPWQGRGMAFLQKTKMPAIIVESFFIDNDRDLRIGNANKQKLAAAYADALLKFVG